MKQFSSYSEWREFRRSLNWTLGFVPTMGALHEGHLELLRRSKRENSLSAVSIFVNPKQFNDAKDFENYPSNLAKDLELLEREGCDFVIVPTSEEIYADDYRFKVSESKESKVLEGQCRPGHFDGVLTVVLKLLNWVKPHRAYFGEKDYQQYVLIRDMAASFFMDLQVIPVQTIREESGLAMSSRNARLSAEERERSSSIYKALTSKSVEEGRLALESSGLEVEYLEERWGRRLAAVKSGSVRLIDNVPL